MQREKTRSTPRISQTEILASLEDGIVSGRIRPNERLDEHTLAQRYGVSRTPIREVLNRLVSSGLAESRPHQGVFVAAFTLPQLLQMYEVMSELEGLCARLAARRMIAEERESLRLKQQAASVLVDSGDAAAYAQHNVELHELIFKGSHNEFLETTTKNLRRRLEPYRRFSFQLNRRLQESHDEHGRVVDHILSGNAEEACAALRQHMDIRRENFSDYLMLLSKALSAN